MTRAESYEYGDLDSFNQWLERQGSEQGRWTTTEYGVFEGRGRHIDDAHKDVARHGWFQFIKSFSDLDQAAEYAKAAPHRFVLQRDVHYREWQ